MSLCRDHLSSVSYPRTKMCDGREGSPFSKLVALDARITEAERELSRLRLQRIPIKTEINEVQDTLLSRLPVEVVAQVFTFCTPTMADACHSEPYRTMGPAPLSLGAVCYAWRMIAWSTPKLWSSISVNICREDLVTLVSLTEDWLDRSGTLPLTINLYSTFHEQDYLKRASSHTMYFLNGIKQRSRRWQHLALEMPHNYILQLCDNPNIAPPDDLQSLYIFRSDLAPPDQCPTLRLNAQHSPRAVALRELAFRHLDIKWKNLTYLRVDEELPLSLCLEILHRIPKLEYFGFSLNGHNADHFGEIPRHLQHDALRALQFRANFPMYLVDAFLWAIILPALEELDYDAQMLQLPVQSIISTIRSSCVGVRKLSLAVDYSCDKRALHILKETPSVTDLTLTISQTYGNGNLLDTVGDLFQTLFESKRIEVEGVDKQSLLPNLESLTVKGPAPSSWQSVGSILNLQHSSSVSDKDRVKFRPLRSLNIFIVNKYRTPLSHDLMSFIAFRREGIALNIFQTSVDNYGRVRNLELISDFEKKQTAVFDSPAQTVPVQA